MIEYREGTTFSGFTVLLDDSTELSSGTYTYEATTSDGEVLTYTVQYPGNPVIPVIEASSFSYEEKEDGSLELNWTNPTEGNNYDQILIYLADQDWDRLFMLRPDLNAETLTIPASIMENLKAQRTFSSMKGRIQTRLYGDDGHNYARSFSDIIDITLN